MGSRLLLAAVVVAMLMSEACGHLTTSATSTIPTPTAQAVTPPLLAATVISDTGFGGGARVPAVMAAPSLVDFLGLLYWAGVHPTYDECKQFPEFGGSCWLGVKDPGDSLMVAARIDEPCMVTQSVSASLSAPTEVTISVINSGGCPGGLPPAPHLSLLEIPLAALPADEIRVTLVHVGAAIPAASMLVDLHRPLAISTDVELKIGELRAAYAAASSDAARRVPPSTQISFLSVGTERWADTGLGCPISGTQYAAADARGYDIFLTASDEMAMPMAYHEWNGYLAFCGRVPIASVAG